MRVVLKIGGRVAHAAAAQALALRADGHEVVVVHGAGPQITEEMERRGIPVSFVGGRRVTGAAALDVVRASLAGVNAAVCRALGEHAVPLLGDEIGLEAEAVPGLGFVGDPRPSAPVAVTEALAQGKVPVVSPLAAGPLNVNADEMAAALAVGLGADRLLFVTDVPGVLLDDRVVDELRVDDAERMLAAGVFEGGIVPKLAAAVHAARRGVPSEIGRTAVTA